MGTNLPPDFWLSLLSAAKSHWSLRRLLRELSTGRPHLKGGKSPFPCFCTGDNPCPREGWKEPEEEGGGVGDPPVPRAEEPMEILAQTPGPSAWEGIFLTLQEWVERWGFFHLRYYSEIA